MMLMVLNTISPMQIARAMMPGKRCWNQSSKPGAQTFFVSAFARVTLLNPQLTHTTASGGSSSAAQWGHRGTSLSSTTPMLDGPSSSSSYGFLVGGGGGLAGAAGLAGFASGS